MRDLTCPEMSDQTPTAPVATRYVHRARHHPAWVEDVDRVEDDLGFRLGFRV